MRKILKVIAKTIKIILVTLSVIVAVLILLYFIPVKFAVQPENIDYEKEFYIICFITPYSTDSGCYIWNSQEDSLECLVELTGADLREDISSGIYNKISNKFIIYGTLDGKQLHVDKWDIMEKIDGGTHEKYLTVYDYIDFDDY